MDKRQAKVRERLGRAQDELALVRIDRGSDVDSIDGYVVSVGAEWLLLAVLDHAIVLDGHTALRLEDVRRVRSRSSGDMAQQALDLREQWPPGPPAVQVDLDSTWAMLTSLMTQPLVTVHPENEDADICFVGVPVGLGDRSLRLLEVTPRAVWASRPTKFRLDDITRIDIGGRYEQALLSVAGPARGVA